MSMHFLKVPPEPVTPARAIRGPNNATPASAAPAPWRACLRVQRWAGMSHLLSMLTPPMSPRGRDIDRESYLRRSAEVHHPHAVFGTGRDLSGKCPSRNRLKTRALRLRNPPRAIATNLARPDAPGVASRPSPF